MFYTNEELKKLSFKSIGQNVLVSKQASLYGISRISLGNNVRIDDFCIISAGQGGVTIGDYVHIAAYSSLIGNAEIIMEDFSGLSSRVSIYSSSDDYSGKSLTNPTVPDEYKKVISGKVHLKKHVIVGAGSVILPNVTLGEGSAVGALSLVTRNVDDFVIVAGNPAKPIKNRLQDLKNLETKLLNEKV
jgi:galactoside O-acetyltransferase